MESEETGQVHESGLDLERAFSSDESVRQEWFDSYQIPVFNLGEAKRKMKLISGDSQAAFGNVYQVEVGGRVYAVKFYRKSFNWQFSDRAINAKYDYLGLLIANSVRPDVFVMPYGCVLSGGGKPVGIVMDLVEGAVPLSKFWVDDGKRFDPWVIEGKKLSVGFFRKLREAVEAVMDKGLVLQDLQHTNVLVDSQMDPRIADVQYFVNYRHPYRLSEPGELQRRSEINERTRGTIAHWIDVYFTDYFESLYANRNKTLSS